MQDWTIAKILAEYPFAAGFFEQNRLNIKGCGGLTLAEFLQRLDAQEMEDSAVDIVHLPEELAAYISQMQEFLGLNSSAVQSLSILAGHDKSGAPEGFERLEILTSQIISIVGPTGSGKSRLLADIEWAAQGDTPTGRSILINGERPDPKWRYSANNKLVAQLSQNMNFVMDLTVGEFLQLHAESRMVANAEEICRQILEAANDLAGEKFSVEAAVTSLSGGQSRALMIADTAILSSSPIVLIDEIENAGIDRRKALGLLMSQDKIVLMATHDPLLALMADKRIVIRNGGINAVLETTEAEKQLLAEFDEMDRVMQNARSKLRTGENLSTISDLTYNSIGDKI